MSRLIPPGANAPGFQFNIPAAPQAPPPAVLTAGDAHLLRRLLAERAGRSIEGLKLYQPLPIQDAFHASQAPERILRGSNRGGKTLPAAVEVARAVTCADPYGKYKGKGRCFCVGKDGRHIAEVMWRKLSRAESFKMIRDKVSGIWRSFRPWEPEDLERVKEAKWAPPLIPTRLIQDICWENKKAGKPEKVTLKTGWEIVFLSSEGKPPNGVDVDLVWFDEEIVDASWYPEMAARLLDREGLFLWSATPQAGTEQLYQLHERSLDEAAKPAPSVTEHVILLHDNPHLTQQQKDLLASKLSEEEHAVRVGGEFAILSTKIFPEYAPKVHACEVFPVPPDWTRYAVVDPGHQVCAVLFGAVPPPDLGDFCYLYEELYLKNCNAETFGQQMARVASGQTFQAFLIDRQGGQVTEAGSGLTIEWQYSEALRRHGVRSIATGHGFVPGAPEPKAGVEKVRDWLRARAGAPPKLRVFRDRLKCWEDEVKRYRYKRVSGLVTDEPESRGRVHLMACTRYLAMYGPKWFRPPAGGAVKSGVLKAVEARRKKSGEGRSKVQLG